MDVKIRPENPARPDFVGAVEGSELRKALTPPQVAAIEAGTDRFAVPVFRDQRIDDELQLAFARNCGSLQTATGDIVRREARRRLFNLGNLTGHATRRAFTHAQVWRRYDLLRWDNRITMHRARRYPADPVRELRRAPIAGVAPTLQQAA